MDELPGQVQAGEPVTVSFLVQQHGRHPLELPAEEVVIMVWPQTGGEAVEVAAIATEEPGRYTAEIVFPAGVGCCTGRNSTAQAASRYSRPLGLVAASPLAADLLRAAPI